MVSNFLKNSPPPVTAHPRHLPASARREQRPPACASAIFSPRHPSSAARPPAVAAPPPRLHLRSSGRGKRWGCCSSYPSRLFLRGRHPCLLCLLQRLVAASSAAASAQPPTPAWLNFGPAGLLGRHFGLLQARLRWFAPHCPPICILLLQFLVLLHACCCYLSAAASYLLLY